MKNKALLFSLINFISIYYIKFLNIQYEILYTQYVNICEILLGIQF